jgi:diaminopimelate decarboxylase
MGLLPDSAHRSTNGHLVLGGCDTVELARQSGTPLYVYDRLTLYNAVQAYRRALRGYPATSAVAYASKAYLCVALAQLWAREGLDVDVVGPGELEVALRGGMPPGSIHLHGNNKPPSLLQRAVEVGVGRIVVDGWHDLERLESLSPERPVAVWLRLAPGVDVHTHDYRKTGLIESKFGFPISTGEAARAVERALNSPAVQLVGLHAHIGSQIFEVEPFVACAEILIGFAAQMCNRYDWRWSELCLGGGWGVSYSEADSGQPIELYVKATCTAVVERCQAHRLPLPRLELEPGRSLVARAGVSLYTVGGRKTVPGRQPYVMLDGGLADNPRPALYGARYTALCADHEIGSKETVTLCGPFCESGDVLARDVELPATRPGDLVAVPISGAYQLSMASPYNGFPRPAAVMVAEGQAHLMQRRETIEDWVSRDLALPRSVV